MNTYLLYLKKFVVKQYDNGEKNNYQNGQLG